MKLQDEAYMNDDDKTISQEDLNIPSTHDEDSDRISIDDLVLEELIMLLK